MKIITRNTDEVLKTDGTWGYSCFSNSIKVFESHQEAKNWIEQEALPEDFVSIDDLDELLVEKNRRVEEFENRERKSLEHCSYVQLADQQNFYKTAEADVWNILTFDKFTATHTITFAGQVIGTFGSTSDDEMPFYSYVHDEYGYAFENCYSREQPTMESTHDYRQEGF